MLVVSPVVWDQRIAVLSTLAFIHAQVLGETLSPCTMLRAHPQGFASG